jgi:hypothetical protein
MLLFSEMNVKTVIKHACKCLPALASEFLNTASYGNISVFHIVVIAKIAVTIPKLLTAGNGTITLNK